MAWTQFWDMSSGGGQKEPWHYIYIEAPEDEAKRVFFAKFGHDPQRVSCTCCGEDYSISESETLEEATEYHRNGMPLGEYLAAAEAGTLKGWDHTVKVIRADEIKPEERTIEVHRSGYIWVD